MKKVNSATKLFQQDIVQKISDPEYIGIVLRCWHDEDPPHNLPPHVDPLMRPLNYGQVGVSFLSHNGKREILSESELRLLDRTLQPGDYCKRSHEDVRAGVVINIQVRGLLQHAISREDVPGWKSVDDLLPRTDAEIGDYVAHGDWIGQVVEVRTALDLCASLLIPSSLFSPQVFDEYIVQLSSGQLVRLPELGSRLTVGEMGPHVLPPPESDIPDLYGMFSRLHANEKDIVLAVKHNTYAIAWLALNQSLDPSTSETKPRPPRFWSGDKLDELTLILGVSDIEMRLGDRVELQNTHGLPFTQHGQENDPTGILNVHMFRVKETTSILTIKWMDGTTELLKSTEVIPYLNPDEYDCWPGDYVVWKSEGQRRPAIVQSVKALERTATILFPDTGAEELASLLELDPHGNTDLELGGPSVGNDTFGVHVGDFVFIHAPGTTNGMTIPRVPRIGEVEPWVRENPFEGDDFAGWRRMMHDIGSKIAAERAATGPEKPLRLPLKGDGKFLWFGEVTALNLDGSVQVTHPDSSQGTYLLNRLTRLYDGIEQLEDDGWGEGSSQGHGEDELWEMDETGDWQPTGEGDGWEDVADGDENMVLDEDEEREPEEHFEDARDSMDTGDQLQTMSHSPRLSSGSQTPLDVPVAASHNVVMHDVEDDDVWLRFKILSTAPPDHAFYGSAPSQPSKSFLGRLRKEYRALESSLPDSILVRAYEDRTDLLRSLIIGPENTPYADAPFVIDWQLDSNFPQSPPIAHFLSWTNGNGRVNPNLYEEGKVCLSILGTWSGDKHEVWNPTRSSLLQALVSIQGLVLVKEPWFCEPAYEKLRGTEEGTVNSRLYNEKAYVLSRGFVRRALEIPLGGLEEEIKHLYHDKRRLQKVVSDAQALIDKSRRTEEVSGEEKDLAVPRLSMGGIITLERTLAKLSTFQNVSA